MNDHFDVPGGTRFALENAGNLNGKLNATPNDIKQLAKTKTVVNDFILKFKKKNAPRID